MEAANRIEQISTGSLPFVPMTPKMSIGGVVLTKGIQEKFLGIFQRRELPVPSDGIDVGELEKG